MKMDPIILAIISAVFLGLNATIIKMGVYRKPFTSNAVITFITAAVLMWLYVFLTNKPLPSLESLPFYILSGILAPGLSALFNFESFKRV